MIQGKFSGLYGSYGISCGIWHQHIMAHCITSCMGTSYFMGVGAWLESNTTIGDLVGGLNTVGRSPTELHGCIKRKTCVG